MNMRFPAGPRTAALALAALLPAACATTSDDSGAPPVPPPGAQEATRTESNGDVVTEYRVGGTVAMVKITPTVGDVLALANGKA